MFSNRMWRGLLIVALACGGLMPAMADGKTFFVSSSCGKDANNGLSPQTPWQTLKKVNAAELQPGDNVLFRRGDAWRGTLVPRSGSEGKPVTYGAYGEGEKPLLLGSVNRSDPKDWRQEGPNLWTTAQPSFGDPLVLDNFTAPSWSVHTEHGAKVKTETVLEKGALPRLQIECVNSGDASHHIQLSNRGFHVVEGNCYQFAFRAKCNKPSAGCYVALFKQSSPWINYGKSNLTRINIGPDWTEYVVRFKATQTADDGRITLYLGGTFPSGATLSFQPVSWRPQRDSKSSELSVDVGNILFDHGKATGVKQWKPEDLKQQGDYCYCGDTWQVKLYSTRNPAELHRSVELALRSHIILQSHKSYVVYDNLSLRYGAAHGIAGGDTHHIIVRNCDIAWIGGGHQFTTPDGHPVRFGNGIEFWENAHDNLVERCRIWEVYDAALTNQGGSNNVQANLTYRNNVIWNCEYSFEYWNRGPESTTRNIRFERNTCVDAGHGWGHVQRPDRNGAHLMFYVNSAKTSEFIVRGNIFSNSTECCLRMDNDWTAALTMDSNCWFQPQGPLIRFLRKPLAASQFMEFQRRTGQDAHSVVADPKFIDAEKLDFRLANDSPVRSFAGADLTVNAADCSNDM